MPIKKSDLYSSLWKSCDELRGGMDASQYKDHVLVLLFVKYVSDKAASQKNYLLEVPKGGSFADMVELKGNKDIGDKMNKIVAKLAQANDLEGVFDVADWRDNDKLGKGKEMVDRLSNLVAIFDNPALDFRGNRAEGDDLLGDAYGSSPRLRRGLLLPAALGGVGWCPRHHCATHATGDVFRAPFRGPRSLTSANCREASEASRRGAPLRQSAEPSRGDRSPVAVTIHWFDSHPSKRHGL